MPLRSPFPQLLCQRSSYSLGSHVGVNPKSFELITDPYLATFMAPQRKGTNLRMAFLHSTKDKAVRKAFDADAEYGKTTRLVFSSRIVGGR
jgi:hypothetical protein